MQDELQLFENVSGENISEYTSVLDNVGGKSSIEERGLVSPTRPRQRIRPAPFLNKRRNSIQGCSDTEDDIKRPKTSSITLNLNAVQKDEKFAFTSRKRTESACSIASESNFARDQRSRRTYIADESQKIMSAKKVFHTKYNGQSPEKSVLKMFDFIYYNPTSNPMTTTKNYEVRNKDNIEESVINPQSDDNNEKELIVPQLKLGPHGELVLDEKSLIIETTAEKQARASMSKTEVIYMDENSENSGFYKRQKRTRDWTSDETIKFYKCLHTVGTDFSLMLTLFPNRTRRDLKLKFKKEEKYNSGLVNKALLYPKTFDIDELKRELERAEIEAAENEKKWESIQKTSKKVILPPYNWQSSKGAHCLKEGDIAYENECLLPKNVQKCRVNKAKEKSKNLKVIADVASNEVILNDSASNKNALVNTTNIGNSEKEGSTLDLSGILSEILSGSLVVVSSEDKNSDKVLHEIYVMCKETGQLSDEPLDLPEDVIKCIISEIRR